MRIGSQAEELQDSGVQEFQGFRRNAEALEFQYFRVLMRHQKKSLIKHLT